MTLTQEENDKFATFLEQEVKTARVMIERMEKIEVPEALIKHRRTEALACGIVAQMLRSGEIVTIENKEQDRGSEDNDPTKDY